jgi:hypothetical protein
MAFSLSLAIWSCFALSCSIAFSRFAISPVIFCSNCVSSEAAEAAVAASCGPVWDNGAACGGAVSANGHLNGRWIGLRRKRRVFRPQGWRRNELRRPLGANQHHAAMRRNATLVHTSAFTGKPESGSLCKQSETWCFIISRDRLNRPLYEIAMVVWCCPGAAPLQIKMPPPLPIRNFCLEPDSGQMALSPRPSDY